jgi:hypothetical protein
MSVGCYTAAHDQLKVAEIPPARRNAKRPLAKGTVAFGATPEHASSSCDALTRRPAAMPWERVEKPYRFEGPECLFRFRGYDQTLEIN